MRSRQTTSSEFPCGNPECPRHCGGHVRFVLRTIEPPFEGMEKLGAHDLQCDTCHQIFARNVFGLKFHLTVRQTKKLIRRIVNETGTVTISNLLDRWPIEVDVADQAFLELNEGTAP